MVVDFINEGLFPDDILTDTKIELDVVFDDNVEAVSYFIREI